MSVNRTATARQGNMASQPDEGKPRLKHDFREIVNADPNTANLGFIGQSAYKRALGTAELPTDLAVVSDAHMGKVGEWAGFTKELFGSLYDPAGMKKLPEDKINATGAELIGAAESQAQWSELRAASRCHPLVASEAARDLAAAVATATGIDQIPDDPEAQKSPEDLRDEREKIENIPIDPTDAQGQKDKQEALDQIDKALNKGKARRDAISDKLKKNGNQIGRAVKAAADKAQQMASAVNGLAECGFGTGAGGGEKDQITPELIKQALQMPDFAKILALVGRMQSATDEKAEEAEGLGRLAPTGLRLAREITDVLPSELAMYPGNEVMFVAKLLDHELLGEERESPEPKNKGDLMIFVDRSGSMNGPRIEWARALAIAGILQAEKQNRRWTVTMYADYGSKLLSSSSEKGFQHAMNTVSVNAGGGTNTDWAIRTVLENNDFSDGLRDPDILLITDGDWEDLKEETTRLLDGKKMRMFVVQLEGQMRKIEAATKVWRVEDLNIDAASNILLEVRL